MLANVKEKLHWVEQIGKENFIQDYWNRRERLNSAPLKQKAGEVFKHWGKLVEEYYRELREGGQYN